MEIFLIVLSSILLFGALGYMAFRGGVDSKSGVQETPPASSEPIPPATEEAENWLKATISRFEVSGEVAPISRQLEAAISGRAVPDGGVFDSFVRGYILGYVNALLVSRNAGGIDASPHLTADIFSIMFGDDYGNDSAGLDELNECLKERRNSENAGASCAYAKGYSAGAEDFSAFAAGNNPAKLQHYVSSVLSHA